VGVFIAALAASVVTGSIAILWIRSVVLRLHKDAQIDKSPAVALGYHKRRA